TIVLDVLDAPLLLLVLRELQEADRVPEHAALAGVELEVERASIPVMRELQADAAKVVHGVVQEADRRVPDAQRIALARREECMRRELRVGYDLEPAFAGDAIIVAHALATEKRDEDREQPRELRSRPPQHEAIAPGANERTAQAPRGELPSTF